MSAVSGAPLLDDANAATVEPSEDDVLVPRDWEGKPLAEYISYISYGFTNPMPTSEAGVFMVTAADIYNGRIQYSTARRTTVEAFRHLLTDKSRPRRNDVLLTKDGALGRVAVVGDEPICVNQSVAVLRPNKSIDPNFLQKLLEAPSYQKTMLENAGGTTIKHLYITIVPHMLISVPTSLTEQQAIAEALSDADALIEGLESLIAKKRAIKQGAMQDLLTGKRRLPGFKGEWGKVRLKDECALITKGTTPTSIGREFQEDGINFIKVESISKSGRLLPEMFARIDLETHRLLSRSQIQEGDILFSIAGALGRAALMPKWMTPANTNQALAIVRLKTNSQLTHSFAYLYLIGPEHQDRITSFSVEAAQANLSLEDIGNFLLPIPPRIEQSAIAAVLFDMDAEIGALDDKLAKVRQVKQGMMQELLTGRVRLV